MNNYLYGQRIIYNGDEKATEGECHETILLILNHLDLKAVRTKNGVELKDH